MEDRFRRHVDGLFEETAPTKKAVELKEEMIQNLQEKYKDLLAEGNFPETAFNIAISGIGDVSVLLDELARDKSTVTMEVAQRKSAMLTAIAVMVYIVSVLPLIIFGALGNWHGVLVGLVILFVFIAAGTGLLIYNYMTRPKFHKTSDAMDEEAREWQGETSEHKSMRRAISAALWSLIVVFYFIISFSTNAWHITWVIFLIGSAIEAIIEAILHWFRGRKK